VPRAYASHFLHRGPRCHQKDPPGGQVLKHLELRELYANAGQKEKAMETLKKTETMFQEMGMEYWLAMMGKVSAEL
jgi:hypothetical protein